MSSLLHGKYRILNVTSMQTVSVMYLYCAGETMYIITDCECFCC
jgi:hypothetical protein